MHSLTKLTEFGPTSRKAVSLFSVATGLAFTSKWVGVNNDFSAGTGLVTGSTLIGLVTVSIGIALDTFGIVTSIGDFCFIAWTGVKFWGFGKVWTGLEMNGFGNDCAVEVWTAGIEAFGEFCVKIPIGFGNDCAPEGWTAGIEAFGELVRIPTGLATVLILS